MTTKGQEEIFEASTVLHLAVVTQLYTIQTLYYYTKKRRVFCLQIILRCLKEFEFIFWVCSHLYFIFQAINFYLMKVLVHEDWKFFLEGPFLQVSLWSTDLDNSKSLYFSEPSNSHWTHKWVKMVSKVSSSPKQDDL